MKAVVVTPLQKDSARLSDVPEPQPEQGQALVRIIRMGLCGTDAEINQGLYGFAPPGSDYLILGHENFGVVEDAGSSTRVKKGDYVVATVRRPDDCINCRAGESDMCLTGNYTERGIKMRHGYIANYYAESDQYLIHIPPELKDIAVLLEPYSIIAKGLWQAWKIQERMVWQPQTALVFGAGTVGLLAALALRAKGLDVVVAARSEPPTTNSQLADAAGAQYVSLKQTSEDDLPKALGGRVDIVFEATGFSPLAFKAMELITTNGVVIMSSVTGGGKSIQFPSDKVNQRMVLGNMLAFGTVNANRRYFEMGVQDFQTFEEKFPGLLPRFITKRVPLEEFDYHLLSEREGVKTTIEVSRQD